MSKTEISEDRLRELEDAAELLRRLEAAGVDNWEGYSIATDGYVPKSEMYIKANEFLNELTVGSYIDYPAGREAGHQILFSDNAVEMVISLMEGKDGSY